MMDMGLAVMIPISIQTPIFVGSINPHGYFNKNAEQPEIANAQETLIHGLQLGPINPRNGMAHGMAISD